MICSSVKRFFTSNLLVVGDWTPDRGATQRWGDVGSTWTTGKQAFPLGTRQPELAPERKWKWETIDDSGKPNAQLWLLLRLW